MHFYNVAFQKQDWWWFWTQLIPVYFARKLFVIPRVCGSIASYRIFDSSLLSSLIQSSFLQDSFFWFEEGLHSISASLYSVVRVGIIRAVWKTGFFLLPLPLFLLVVLLGFPWRICPQTTFHHSLDMIALLGCTLIKRGEKWNFLYSLQDRTLSPQRPIPARSPLRYPWDWMTSTWTPDILGLCASVPATELAHSPSSGISQLLLESDGSSGFTPYLLQNSKELLSPFCWIPLTTINLSLCPIRDLFIAKVA